MLIRTTGPIEDDFHLLTLGHTCHYLLGDSAEFYIFDPGLSAHCPMLLRRIHALELDPRALSHIFLTHLHADRIAGVPLLRRHCRKAQLVGTAAMRAKLSSADFVRSIFERDRELSKIFQVDAKEPPVTFEEFFSALQPDRIATDSEVFALRSGKQARLVSAPGHTQESVVFQILPYSLLVVDEGFGYYRGRELAAPGGDAGQDLAIQSIAKLARTAITGLCFPEGGVLTGQLVKRHLDAINQNTADLFSESARAHEIGMSDDEIRASIFNGFYLAEQADPVLKANLETSFEAMWAQVLARREPKA